MSEEWFYGSICLSPYFTVFSFLFFFYKQYERHIWLINFEELFWTNHKQIFFYGFEKNYTKSAVKLSGFFQITNKTRNPLVF